MCARRRLQPAPDRRRRRRDRARRDGDGRGAGAPRGGDRSAARGGRAEHSGGVAARHRFSWARGIQRPSRRARDAALPQAAGGQGSGAGSRHDPARLLHDEAERDRRDDPALAARLRRHPPVRAARADRGLRRGHRAPVGMAARRDRLRRGLAAAERRLAGRVCRAAGHPRLPCVARRAAARHLPDPVERARHQSGERHDGRLAGGRRRLRPRRQRRSWPTSPPRPSSTGHASPR